MSDKLYIRGGLAANRPTLDPREPGFDMDTKKLWIGTTTGNAQVAMAMQEAWIAPTLQNVWVNTPGSPPAGYYKDDSGIVRLRGLIKSGTTAPTTLLFTLPAGYRPAFSILLNTLTFDGTTIKALDLFFNLNGNVSIDTVAASSYWLNLDGLSFRTGV